MRRRPLYARAILGAALFVLCATAAALAQNDGEVETIINTAGPHLDHFLIDITAGFIGFLGGAFFSPALREVRGLIGGFIVLIAALAIVGTAWFGSTPWSEAFTSFVAIVFFVVALFFGMQLGAKAGESKAADQPTSFGSAKWATDAYLESMGLFAGKGFLIGQFFISERPATRKTPAIPATYKPLYYGGTRHLLSVAPTRSGKGVSSIIPNLLTYEGSMFVIDPKGENALVTAARRGRGDKACGIPGLGQSVFLIDPWNIAASALGLCPARFNPLDWIKPDDPDAAENAFLLADALVPGDAQGEARFWDDETKALLTGIILYVATSSHEAGNRHLGRVRDILLLDDDEFKTVLGTMYNEPLPVISSTAARTAGKDPKLRSNVLAAAQSHTHFLDSPRIRESLSASDFRFDDLKTQPTTVYLILPADRLKTFDRWLRLLIQQAITVNARNIAIKPEKPVLFMLDEMASLGRLSMVEQAYGLMAGFGMQLWGIVQDLSQLERIYGTGWQTFISNSGVIQYFGSRDKMTAEYFSALCGVTTIAVRSFSYAFGRVFSQSSGGQNSSSSESTSHTNTSSQNESQRHLVYPDELMVLKNHIQLIFVENLDPIRAIKLRWYREPALRALGVNLHPAEPSPPPPMPAPAPAPEPAQELAFITALKFVVAWAMEMFRKLREDAPTPTPPPLQDALAGQPHKSTDPKSSTPTMVKNFQASGANFRVYSDGSIEVNIGLAKRLFPSKAEFDAFVSERYSVRDRQNIMNALDA